MYPDIACKPVTVYYMYVVKKNVLTFMNEYETVLKSFWSTSYTKTFLAVHVVHNIKQH